MLLSLLKHIDENDDWEAKKEQESVRAYDNEYCGGAVPRHMATGAYRFTLKWQKVPKKARRKMAVGV